jgi:cysteinyl-tRNA synthetase
LLDNGEDASGIAGAVEEIVGVLGLDDASEPIESTIDLSALAGRFDVTGDTDEIVAALIGLREEARSERRFEDADAIRDGLDEAGVILEDGPDGTRWLRK